MTRLTRNALVCSLTFSFFAPAALGAAATPTVEDIGVLGLLSHDLFGWDSRTQMNTDNGRLDLSTIFDFAGGTAWNTGGNPKNSENAPVFSVTMNLVDAYSKSLAHTNDPQIARRKAVGLFRDMVTASFKRVTGLPFPDSTQCSAVTNEEQAAFRALHDLLPGAIALDSGSVLYLTDYRTARTRLSATELMRTVPSFNGTYDTSYLSISMPGNRPPINLQEADKAFIESLTSYRQADMLAELAEVGATSRTFDKLSFYSDFVSAFRKAGCVDQTQFAQ